MQNTILMHPYVAAAVASDRQQNLLNESRRWRTIDRLQEKSENATGLRRTVGLGLVRAGTKLAGRQASATLVSQPAV